MPTHFFTSESVTEGHSDKLCDQISDAVLDAYLEQDPQARVACETAATTGLVLVMGEISSSARVDIVPIARKVILDIGYTRGKYGFDGERCAVMVTLDKQSPDIAMGVNRALETRASDASDVGAGDQGMMFGYACNETPERMPLAISLSHRLAKRLSDARKSNELSWLRPDGKTQVTVEYDNNKPVRVDTVLISTQHAPTVSQDTIHRAVVEQIIRPVVGDLMDSQTRCLVNPTGRFVIGGPTGDSGLTGRKIIVDTYGGYARHGGGAFSGKDPTKVDRSAAYAARYIAKNIVAAQLAERCEIEVAYAIGVAHPVSIMVDTQGTGRIPDTRITQIVREVFDLRPAAIIEELDLLRPIYRKTAAYGHFGRTDISLPWEQEDRVALITAKA